MPTRSYRHAVTSSVRQRLQERALQSRADHLRRLSSARITECPQNNVEVRKLVTKWRNIERERGQALTKYNEQRNLLMSKYKELLHNPAENHDVSDTFSNVPGFRYKANGDAKRTKSKCKTITNVAFDETDIRNDLLDDIKRLNKSESVSIRQEIENLEKEINDRSTTDFHHINEKISNLKAALRHIHSSSSVQSTQVGEKLSVQKKKRRKTQNRAVNCKACRQKVSSSPSSRRKTVSRPLPRWQSAPSGVYVPKVLSTASLHTRAAASSRFTSSHSVDSELFQDESVIINNETFSGNSLSQTAQSQTDTLRSNPVYARRPSSAADDSPRVSDPASLRGNEAKLKVIRKVLQQQLENPPDHTVSLSTVIERDKDTVEFHFTNSASHIQNKPPKARVTTSQKAVAEARSRKRSNVQINSRHSATRRTNATEKKRTSPEVEEIDRLFLQSSTESSYHAVMMKASCSNPEYSRAAAQLAGRSPAPSQTTAIPRSSGKSSSHSRSSFDGRKSSAALLKHLKTENFELNERVSDFLKTLPKEPPAVRWRKTRPGTSIKTHKTSAENPGEGGTPRASSAISFRVRDQPDVPRAHSSYGYSTQSRPATRDMDLQEQFEELRKCRYLRLRKHQIENDED